jgi:hypothetical protein
MSRWHAFPRFNPAIAALLAMVPFTSFANFEPPGGELLRQDFSRADLLAAQWQPITGVWSAAGGTYNSTTTGSSSLTTIFAYPNPAGGADLPAIPFDRYRLHTRMLNPSAGGLVGVVYQYQNAANYYEAVFSSAGTASLRRVANDLVTSPWRRATDYRYRARMLNQWGASGLVYNYQGADDLGTGDRYEVVFAPTGQA